MSAAIDAMREAFGQLAAGTVELPLRAAVRASQPDGTLLVMPGRVEAPFGLGGKFVTVFPQNADRARPILHAAVLLANSDTGEIAALVEGTSLTAIRTGAASGLATALLAREDASRAAIIGSGVQARTQLEAMCCVRKIESVAVYSRSRVNAERFAVEMGRHPDVPSPIHVAASVREAVREADIVCTATTTTKPVLSRDDVPAGVHINAIGSFTPGMQEIDPELLADALVVVDQHEAALAEAGEVIAAVDQGLISPGSLVELGNLLGGAGGRLNDDQVTVFKSVGIAVQDLCAANRAVGFAALHGLGVLAE